MKNIRRIKLIIFLLAGVITLLILSGSITSFSFNSPTASQVWSLLKLGGYAVALFALAIFMTLLVQKIEKRERADEKDGN